MADRTESEPASLPESPPAAGAQWEEGSVKTSDGLSLHYRLYGAAAGAPIVLLHGGPGQSFMGVGPDLVPLSQHGPFLQYDQRGGGRSERDPQAASQTVDTHVEDLETVRTHFGYESMTLVGHSWGCALAAHYAHRYGERVVRMILIGPMEPNRELLRQRVRLVATADPKAAAELEAVNERDDLKDDPIALCRARMEILQRFYYHDVEKMALKKGDYCDVPPDAPERGDTISKAVIRDLGDYDLEPLLSELRMPVLVVEGAQTPLPAEGCPTWARSVRNGRLWLIDQVGHAYPFVEAPEVFFPGIEVFLGGAWPEGAVAV